MDILKTLEREGASVAVVDAIVTYKGEMFALHTEKHPKDNYNAVDFAAAWSARGGKWATVRSEEEAIAFIATADEYIE